MTDDAVDMTDAEGQQWTRTGRYRMACWRIDELTAQLSASEAARVAAEKLAEEHVDTVTLLREQLAEAELDIKWWRKEARP